MVDWTKKIKFENGTPARLVGTLNTGDSDRPHHLVVKVNYDGSDGKTVYRCYEDGSSIFGDDYQVINDLPKDDFTFPYEILDNYDSDKQPAKGIRSDKDDRRVLQYFPLEWLAENLVEGFSWRHTEEGYYYWNEVYSRLRRIARDGH